MNEPDTTVSLTEDEGLRWTKAYDHAHHAVRMALRDHPKLGASLSFAEGEKWANDLASRLSYDIHRIIDPAYDA